MSVELAEKEPEGALTLYEQAKGLVIQGANDYLKAGDFLLFLKDEKKARVNFFKPLKQAADKAKQALLDREKISIKHIEDAIETIESSMLEWKKEQDRIAELEAIRRAEIVRKQEEDRRIVEALQAEQEGDKEAVEALLNEPIDSPLIKVASAAQKISGLTERLTWKHKVDDLRILVQAVAAGKVPLHALKADDVFLGNQARAMRGHLNYPGVTSYSESSLVGTRK
jgi:hypothetical protein